MTTSMVGFKKKGHMSKNLSKNGEPKRKNRECRRRLVTPEIQPRTQKKNGEPQRYSENTEEEW